MDKLKYSWTIFPQTLNRKYFMDIGHVTWTLATTHGQLSVVNRCPWPIVHEIDKTDKLLAENNLNTHKRLHSNEKPYQFGNLHLKVH